MYFDSLQALLVMNGHGAFVWSAVLISVLLMASQVIIPMLRTRRFYAQQLQQMRRDQQP